MRWLVLFGVSLLSIGTAWAQNGGSEIVVPPAPVLTPETPQPPAPVQAPAQQPPPGLVPVQPPAAGDAAAPATPGGSAPATANQPPPPDVAPPPSTDWTQNTTATLGVLNKVDGSTSQLTLAVGGPAQTSGDLSVSVQACLTRPAGQLPDSAVFVTVTPVPQGGAPIYRGWMLHSAPGAAFAGNAGQTFRVIGCS